MRRVGFEYSECTALLKTAEVEKCIGLTRQTILFPLFFYRIHNSHFLLKEVLNAAELPPPQTWPSIPEIKYKCVCKAKTKNEETVSLLPFVQFKSLKRRCRFLVRKFFLGGGFHFSLLWFVFMQCIICVYCTLPLFPSTAPSLFPSLDPPSPLSPTLHLTLLTASPSHDPLTRPLHHLICHQTVPEPTINA